MQELVKKLTETFGVSGFEEEIRAVIRDEIAGLGVETSVDVLGNLVAVRRGRGGGKRVLLAAHMDQVGVMVTHIDAHGYMHFVNVGFLYPLACWGSQVRFRDGTVATIGLDGRSDPLKKLPALSDMYLDAGVSGPDELKLQVGDVAGFFRPFVAQGHSWFAPNMDDRIGCVVLVQLLAALKDRELDHDVLAVFSTQEEVGSRGATAAAYNLEPDVVIALDVTGSGDTPHATPFAVSLGGGPAIKVKDAGMISHPGLNQALIAAAGAAQVPYQLEVFTLGTTDAREMQVSRQGAAASCISIPSRYVHTPSQIVDERDVDGSVRLLTEFLARPIDL